MARKKASDVARAFFQNVKRNGADAPIYYLYGDEPYLLDQAVTTVLEAAAPEGLNEFNFTALRGKETNGDQLLSAAETLPFMTRRRVVLVRGLQEMDLRGLDAMLDYFKDPNPSTCLVLHAMTEQKSIDGRLGAVKKMKKAAEVHEFAKYKEYEAEAFLERQASQRGLTLGNGAAGQIMASIGPSLGGLIQALEKLDLYLGPQTRQVELAHVEELIAETKISSIFELTEALGDRDLEGALYLLHKQLEEGEAAIKINSMIARHFRSLAKLQDPSLRNADSRSQAQAVGVHPYFLKDYARHARKFSPSEVGHILTSLGDIDFQLKSSKLKDRVILERLLFQIAGPTR